MSDFIDFAKDLEKGVTSVSPEDLAPELVDSNIDGVDWSDYEDTDPEFKKMEEADYNKWNLNSSLREAKLQEGIADQEAAYIASTDNPTYKGFMSSEWGNAKVTEERWNKDSAYILKRVKAGSGQMANVAGTQKSKVYDTAGANKDKKAGTPGPYDEDRGEDDGNVSKELQSFADKYGGGTLRGDADEMFQEMQNIVRNIILGRSDKRHAAIMGDPG